MSETNKVQITLTPPKVQAVEFGIDGLTDLLCCALPAFIDNKEEKRKRRAKSAKGNQPTPEDDAEPTGSPEEQFKRSLYHLPDGTLAFPSSAIQAACATYLCRFNPINPRYAKDTPPVFYGATFMLDELMPIICSNPPRMQHDIARNSRGKRIDIYRGAFKDWKMRVAMEFNPDIITLERLINALNGAGRSVGVGAHRPECRGRFGRFVVTSAALLEVKEREAA